MRRAPAPFGETPTRAGRLIVLEGIDGSGKSTQRKRLAAWLRTLEREVVETSEPTSGPFGERFRRFARGELEADPAEVLDLFLKDRREHVRLVIAPGLARGALVLCDRYVASTRAYQAAHGLDPARLLARLEQERAPMPDLALWLRLPVPLALARLGEREPARERFERREFLERVDREYARLGLTEVDAAGPESEVEQALRRHIALLLGHA